MMTRLLIAFFALTACSGCILIDTNPVAYDADYAIYEDEYLDDYFDVAYSGWGYFDVEVVQWPEFGELTLGPDGRFTYLPDPDAHGLDSFSYRVYDVPSYPSNVATVYIHVEPINDAPITITETIFAVAGAWSYGTLPAYDIEGDGLHFAITRQPLVGYVEIIDPYTGEYAFWAPSGAQRTVSFGYHVDDGDLGTYGELIVDIDRW